MSPRVCLMLSPRTIPSFPLCHTPIILKVLARFNLTLSELYVSTHRTLSTELFSEELVVGSLSSSSYSQAEWNKLFVIEFFSFTTLHGTSKSLALGFVPGTTHCNLAIERSWFKSRAGGISYSVLRFIYSCI